MNNVMRKIITMKHIAQGTAFEIKFESDYLVAYTNMIDSIGCIRIFSYKVEEGKIHMLVESNRKLRATTLQNKLPGSLVTCLPRREFARAQVLLNYPHENTTLRPYTEEELSLVGSEYNIRKD